jgi:hypothetical protein
MHHRHASKRSLPVGMQPSRLLATERPQAPMRKAQGKTKPQNREQPSRHENTFHSPPDSNHLRMILLMRYVLDEYYRRAQNLTRYSHVFDGGLNGDLDGNGASTGLRANDRTAELLFSRPTKNLSDAAIAASVQSRHRHDPKLDPTLP